MLISQYFSKKLQVILNHATVILGLLFTIHLGNAQTGCTDPLANNYDINAVTNDGSCTYNPTNISPNNSTQLNSTLNETSGLILWNNEIWTHNDGGNSSDLYNLDITDFTNFTSLNIPGITNEDWEEISQDDTYVYVGDFGNNAQGNRTDLKIYRIDKSSITLGTPIVDVINFNYEDQIDLSPQGGNNTDFDCEAFIVTETSIYLFTKEWVSEETTVYSMPKTPGTYSAVNEGSFDVNGLITGATYVQSQQMLTLSGYSSTLIPFAYFFYDFTDNNFLDGNKRKVGLNLPFHQIEGIATNDGTNYYLSNEFISNFFTIQPQIHTYDFSTVLGYKTSGISSSFSDPNAWAGGQIPPNGSNIIINHDLNLDTNYTASTLQIVNGATLTSNSNLNLNIQNTLSIKSNGHLILEPTAVLDVDGDISNQGTIHFRSDISGTAQFNQFTGIIAGNGLVEVERFIPSGTNQRRAFRLLSSSISLVSGSSIYDNWQEGGASPIGYGTHITGSTTGSNGFDATSTGNPSLFTFDNNFVGTGSQTQTEAWLPIPNTNIRQLIAGEAYLLFVRGDRNYDLTSVPADAPNADVILRASGSLRTGNFSPALSSEDAYFSLVGNPYQSIVNFNNLNFTGDIKSNFVFFWNANLSTKGAFETVDVSLEPEKAVIQPGQSVFVQNSEIVLNSPSLMFTETAKNVGGQVNTVFNQNEVTTLDLELFDLSGQKYDNVKFVFANNNNNAIDDLDAGKLPNLHENLASNNNNTLLSVDRLNIPQDEDSLALFCGQYQFLDYKFKFKQTNWFSDLNVYLEDAYLNTQTLIEPEQEYTFTVDELIPESLATDRFSLVFSTETLSILGNTNQSHVSLYPNPFSDEGLYLNIPEHLVGESAVIEVFDPIGRLIYRDKTLRLSAQQHLQLSTLASGLYTLRVSGAYFDQSFKLKKI